MSGASEPRFSGGCLCGALRYEAVGAPLYQGCCYCQDCRKASGAGFIPYMGFAASQVAFTGEARQFVTRAASGGPSIRNFCPRCGSLVFGGAVGEDDQHTLYAGTLDDPTLFHPTAAIFVGHRPHWAPLPAGVTAFERLPG